MKISVGLASLYDWFEEFNAEAQLECLEMIKDLDVDGVELHFTDEEILSDKFKMFKGKLDNLFVTVHLKGRDDVNYFEKVKELSILLDVQNIVLHADIYDKSKTLLPQDVHFVIENSDAQKDGYQHLKEMVDFPHDICLDINHVEQCFPGKVAEHVALVKNKIKEVHVSALNNELFKEYSGVTSHHKLVYGSDYKIPDCVPRDVVWVIEGVVPKDRLDLLEKEIALLRALDG